MHPPLPLPIVPDPRCHGAKSTCPGSVLITHPTGKLGPGKHSPVSGCRINFCVRGVSEGGCCRCKPPPHSPGHPASRSGPCEHPQLPASPWRCTSRCSLCSVPGYLSRCKLGWGWSRLGVREARNGAETFPLIFCCRFIKYEKVQPWMLWCGAASGWMLDKSTVSAP